MHSIFFCFFCRFLYFVLYGKGLFRVDLAILQPSSKPQPVHIVIKDDVSAFVVDLDNVQLYYPNSTIDSITTSFIDGSDPKDFRTKVVKRAYNGIISMIYYDGVFFWTNGREVWFEEFDPGFSQYRHNNMLFFDKSYSGFNLFHPSAQPTPGKMLYLIFNDVKNNSLYNKLVLLNNPYCSCISQSSPFAMCNNFTTNFIHKWSSALNRDINTKCLLWLLLSALPDVLINN